MQVRIFLICAVAVNKDFIIYTSDNDFSAFSEVLPIKLFDDAAYI